MIEVLDPGQPWPIPLPVEHDALLDRVLEARRPDGTVRARWRYGAAQMASGWVCIEGPEAGPTAPCVGVMNTGYDLFEEIVEGCIKYGWTLWSMPPIKGGTDGEPEQPTQPPAGRQVRLRKRTRYVSG